MIQNGQKRPLCLFVLFFVLVLFLGKLFLSVHVDDAAQTERASLPDEQADVIISGKLVQKEEKNGKAVFYLKNIQIFSPEGVRQNKNESDVFPKYKLNMICYMAQACDIDTAMLGSTIAVQGKPGTFDAAENEGQFDARQYYALSGYSGCLYQAKVISVSGDGDLIGEALYRYKKQSRQFLMAHMTQEDAGVMAAILLGDKGNMDAAQKSLYQKSGIAHILAISGLHISLVGMGLFRLLKRAAVRADVASVLSILLAWLYGKMTGGGSSVTRACCMFALLLLADLLERSYDLLTGLAFSAIVVLIKNPSDLSGAGFLLSFTAVLGIALLGQDQKKQTGRGRIRKLLDRYVMTPLRISFSVLLMTLPVSLWFFYTVSPYGILLNLAVIPVMSVVLLSGMVATLLRFPLLLQVPAMLLHVIDLLCRVSRCLPGWQLVVGRPRIWQIVTYYLVLFGLICLRSRRRERMRLDRAHFAWGNRRRHMGLRWAWLLCLVLNCVVLFLPARRVNAVDMLSVGQGDCVVLRTAEGNCVISDGGSSSEKQVGKYRLIPFLQYNGIRRVDAVFLSHAHDDHYNALLELFEQAQDAGIRVSCLILGSVAQDNARYQEIRDAALAAGAKVFYMENGDEASFGSLHMTCVYECGKQPVSDENDESMVLQAAFPGFTMLLTGDSTQNMDEKVLAALARADIPEVTCLKTAHHGARSSTGEALLARIAPKIALISCGKDNSYGHPHEETLERLQEGGAKVYVTKDMGQIRIRNARRGWVIENYPFREW